MSNQILNFVPTTSVALTCPFAYLILNPGCLRVYAGSTRDTKGKISFTDLTAFQCHCPEAQRHPDLSDLPWSSSYWAGLTSFSFISHAQAFPGRCYRYEADVFAAPLHRRTGCAAAFAMGSKILCPAQPRPMNTKPSQDQA